MNYINGKNEIELPTIGKTEVIMELFEAEKILSPNSFQDIPHDKILICIIENQSFDAAAYCLTEQDFRTIINIEDSDKRGRQWLLIDKKELKPIQEFERKRKERQKAFVFPKLVLVREEGTENDEENPF